MVPVLIYRAINTMYQMSGIVDALSNISVVEVTNN